MNKQLSNLQAFYAMKYFLEKYYEATGSDDVGALLGDLQFFEKEMETADPAAWHDWLECINRAMHPDKTFEPDKLYKP